MNKMKVVSFTYCDDVQNDQDGRVIIIGPMQLITPNFLPTNYSFNVSYGISNADINGFEIRTEFFDPNNNMISDNVLQVPNLSSDDIENAELPVGIQVTVGFRNVKLEIAGEYKTVVTINNTFKQEYPIEVCYVIKS